MRKSLILQGFREFFKVDFGKFSTISTVEKVEFRLFNKFSTSFQQSKNSVLIRL